jgi:hypothetical protein
MTIRKKDIEKWPGDITVESWPQLIEAMHADGMIPKHDEQGGHRRSPFVFRGMSDATWPLATSLQRLGSKPENVEIPALRAFARYAPIGSVSLKSTWDRLAVAQHNGLPTRVLDWTASPLVAAHFATEEAKYRIGEESFSGIIWSINADKLRDRFLPKEMGSYLREERSYVYNVHQLDVLFPSLSDFDGKQAGDFMILFEPPSIDARIQNQFGLLSAMNGPGKSHLAYLRACSKEDPDFVRRFIITEQAKIEIRDMLDQNNITERMLFPGLPGLCVWLRRYYGPA